MRKFLSLLFLFPLLGIAQQNTVCLTIEPNPNSDIAFSGFTKYINVLNCFSIYAENNISDDFINHQVAIINSMTKKEKSYPDIIKASRKIRIANGSGTRVQDVNKLLKQFLQSQKMMKKMKSMGKRGLPNDLLQKLQEHPSSKLN